MRLKEKEIVDTQSIEQVLHEAEICRLGLSIDNQPYVVPLCFGYENRMLYFHCAREGRKLDMIRRNNRVCFEAESECRFVPAEDACKWSMKYRSVIGFGVAEIVTDDEAKRKALDVIMGHYSDKTYTYSDQAVAGMVIIQVRIESMTGKESVS